MICAASRNCSGVILENSSNTCRQDHQHQRESTIQEDRERLRFREVARKAKVILDDTQPVIVPMEGALKLVVAIEKRSGEGPRFTYGIPILLWITFGTPEPAAGAALALKDFPFQKSSKRRVRDSRFSREPSGPSWGCLVRRRGCC